MCANLVQINFRYNVSAPEYEQAVSPLATEISAVEGLRWKIWMIDEETSEAGGIYLFDDESRANAYLGGPIVAQVVSNPALSDFSVKQFEVMEEVTAITHGPIAEPA